MASIAPSDLTDLLVAIFEKRGVNRRHARILGENCAACERDGSRSHGVFRIPGYIASIESGWVDANATPTVEAHSGAYIRIDANRGFAQPALAAASDSILEMAGNTGIAFVAIKRAHHFSALWPDLEPFANKGLVGLSMVTGLKCVSPPGGKVPVFGTNPLAFATPVAGALPLVMDFATSSMSNGDLRLAARARRKVPLGSGIDSLGRQSDDAEEILAGGALLPFGGHKGAALSFMVEIFASAMTGGLFSHEVDFSTHAGAEIPNTGQALVFVDPRRGGNDGFANRVLHLVDAVRGSGDVRLPADRRYANRAEAERNGISLTEESLADLRTLAGFTAA